MSTESQRTGRTEIESSSIDALVRAQDEGRLSAAEATDAFLSRIECYDPALHAYSALWPERARKRASELDAARERGEAIGPLQGVPIAVKDLCDVAGEPTRAGTAVLGDKPAERNAEVVDRLEAAGAVILGKVKMTEGALVVHHASVTPPVNPWNPARWTGISSSGSGVSVAAGLCLGALGTDTGGSIRYPSSACGITGLKPTHGRVSLRGVFPLCDSLDHIGPMARSVDDVARLFAALCGFDPEDDWSLASNPQVAGPSALVPRASGVRLGIDRAYCEAGVAPDIARRFSDAIEVYRDLGAEIVEFSMPDFERVGASWIYMTGTEAANAHADTYPSRADEYGPELRGILELGHQASGLEVAKAWRARTAFSHRLEACFDGVDAILCPVIPQHFPANANLMDPSTLPEGGADSTRFTSPFNISGSPSLTMPAGLDEEGVPVGFQVVGRHREESRLLALGAAFQAATDWHSMRPSLERFEKE